MEDNKRGPRKVADILGIYERGKTGYEEDSQC